MDKQETQDVVKLRDELQTERKRAEAWARAFGECCRELHVVLKCNMALKQRIKALAERIEQIRWLVISTETGPVT